MTDNQKNQIQRLREKGYGYVKIAQELNLLKNTVKSFCRRNPIDSEETNHNICKQCGKPITQNPKRREKKFCSTLCRIKWWNYHQSEIKHRKLSTCRHCGKAFYGKPGRKYCSHKCYIAERFGGNNV